MVQVTDGALVATLGNLSARLEPIDGKDTARVEMIPLRGEVMSFNVEDGNRAESLTYRNQKWQRNDGVK